MGAIVGWYAIIVGVALAMWWAVEIRHGALDRPDRTPAEIRLHLVAELLTAAGLIVGGALLVATGTPGVALAALGALLYTVIQSPGYFVSLGEPGPVVMFAGLGVLTASALAVLLVATYP